MTSVNYDFNSKIRKHTFSILKAIVKALIFYGIYFVLWSFLAPVAEMIPGLQQTIETFIIVYITLMIIGGLASGTIFQHFFNAARALFVIGYLILSLNGGIFGMTFESVSLTIDLRLFLTVAILLSLLGFAKSVLQAVNFMSEKAEYTTF